MAELLDEASSLESTTVAVSRTSATIKGGRRFSFNALVVVGDRRGSVGLGYGKANEVPPAIEKAQKDARKNMKRVPLLGATLPHEVAGRFGGSTVRLIPAAPGTGVVAGASVRAVLEMAGITDCLTKCYGSTNQQNVVKAAMAGLLNLQQKELIAELRGVTIDQTTVERALERSAAFFRAKPTTERKMKGPTNVVGQDRKGGRGGGGGRGGRSRRGPSGGQDSGGPPAESAPASESGSPS